MSLYKDQTFWDFYNIGLTQYQNNSKKTKFVLTSFLNNNNTIDGTAIQQFWFPQIEADIFISHSHKNEDEAIAIAGWLLATFKLKAFIDSCIWGHSDELLLSIDRENCLMPNKGVYDYNLRNHSTSHVHMMLSTALTMMIDKCECLFFFNTPYSVKSYKNTDKTESPWIYAEIATTKIIQKKDPGRTVELTETFSHFDGVDEIKKAKTITHDIDLSHLVKFEYSDLEKWQRTVHKNEHPLDTLYRIKPPKGSGQEIRFLS